MAATSEPASFSDRAKAATQSPRRAFGSSPPIYIDFVKRFGWSLPVLIDPIENPANEVYAGWPERLYIVDEQGRIVHKGGTGPFHFDPEEAAKWLATRFP